MKIHVIPGKQLTPADCARWSNLQRTDPNLDSPCFRPEFVQAVARVRDDVEIAILEEEGAATAFFPFQRSRWGTGRPVGAGLSDFQGLIGTPRSALNVERLLRACRLGTWTFDHLPASQQVFQPYHRAASSSPFIDLSAGFDAYYAQRKEALSRVVSNTARCIRNAERALGTMRIETLSADDRVFRTMLDWKASQYLRTGHNNVFAFPWVIRLLDRIRCERTEAFAGMLTAVYFGDRLTAVHFGMRSYGVLHYWFPAYDVELRQYSPGMILLVRMVQAASSFGIRRIDLGKGDEEYKLRLGSGATAVAEGVIERRSMACTLGHAERGVSQFARMPVLGAPARLAARASRPLRRWMMFR